MGKPIHITMVGQGQSLATILIAKVHVLIGVADGIKNRARHTVRMQANKGYLFIRH
jgi:hypothetical protein